MVTRGTEGNIEDTFEYLTLRVYKRVTNYYINNMICVDDCISKEVADYLNSHPAFIYSQGCIINPEFFDNYIREFTDENKGTVPIADKYRQGIWGQRVFTMGDAMEFLKWLDPKWMDFKHISKSEFFTGSNLELTNDGIEFMDI